MNSMNLKIIEEYVEISNGDFDFNYSEENPFVIVQDWNAIKRFNEWVKKNCCSYFSLEVGMITTEDGSLWIDFLTDDNWGFSDEWEFCSECKDAIHRHYEPHWFRDSTEKKICSECIKESYAEEYVNEHLCINWEWGVPKQNMPLNQIISTETLVRLGFYKAKEELEIGMYGTYDDPVKILTELTEQNHESDFLVHCTSNNPFATYYEIWERKGRSDYDR